MTNNKGSRRYVGFNERYFGRPSKPGNKQDAHGAEPPQTNQHTGPPRLFINDTDFQLYVGDVRDCLRELPAESVHTVVTSPPYWGLRDYGTGSWEGGDPDCDHRQMSYPRDRETPGGRGGSMPMSEVPFRDVCGKCGATRVDQQLGLEPTPEAFVAAMVDVFREVRRVLRADGTLWLNLGDSYASGGGAGVQGEDGQMADRSVVHARRPPRPGNPDKNGGNSNRDGVPRAPGLKPKDMCGIPWRVAFALQADGWYLRSDIIWAKPNPMPESVTDRPTKAHEYVFLLSKSPRYFFDQEAVREPNVKVGTPGHISRGNGAGSHSNTDGMRNRDFERAGRQVGHHGRVTNEAGRNVRSVWELATQPYPEAHFATFPEALPERCIKAGTSERGCCSECGAPWERIVEATRENHRPTTYAVDAAGGAITGGTTKNFPDTTRQTTGWAPSCDHDRTSVPCVVLDPFMGSGTSALVARRLGRKSIGVELNPEYAALCARRLQQLSLFGGETEPAQSVPLSRSRGLTGGAYNPPGQSPHSNARSKP